MKREEAIYKAKHLRKVRPNICVDAEDFWDTVIAALEQEPCTDAISRQAVLEVIRKCHCEEWVKADIGAPIEALTSVTPVKKVGRWVFVKGYEGILYECTVCRNKNTHTTVRWNYCPHCGAKMQEVEE